VIQYSVPVKKMRPVVRPRKNARVSEVPWSASRSGTSAIHPIAGYPKLGKLRASRRPEAIARRRSTVVREVSE
jgi:hypothetical protein